VTIKKLTGVIVLLFIATVALAQTNRDGDRMEGQVSFGIDAQGYSTGRTSRVGSIDATVRLLPRITLEAVATGGVYFGDHFGGGAAYVTLNPNAITYMIAGGSRNSYTGTTVAWSGTAGAGRVLYQSNRRAIRGLETAFTLTKRGYYFSSSTDVLLVNPTAVVYLPRDWTLTLRAGAIRTTIAGAKKWTPSGGAKINVPLTRRLSVSPGVTYDSEPSDVLQIRNISSRGFGAGARFWLTRFTSVDAFYFRVLFGANHLANDSYGVSYALRF
jgi:hypothetical protein